MPLRVVLPCALAVALASCDGAGSDICFVTPDGFVAPNVLEPELRDTIWVGEPFLFRAEYEGEGDVTEVGVRLDWLPPGTDPGDPDADSVLFRRPLGAGPGRYVVEQTVQVDAFRGGGTVADLAPGGQFYLYGYGTVRFAACGGAGGVESAMGVPVTVLDRR